MVTLGSGVPAAAADAGNYKDWTAVAVEKLQTWYDEEGGLWYSTGWWNSANCLTVLGDFAALDADAAAQLDLKHVFSNTFIQAQKTTTTTTRGGASLLVEPRQPPAPAPALAERGGFSGFING